MFIHVYATSLRCAAANARNYHIPVCTVAPFICTRSAWLPCTGCTPGKRTVTRVPMRYFNTSATDCTRLDMDIDTGSAREHGELTTQGQARSATMPSNQVVLPTSQQHTSAARNKIHPDYSNFQPSCCKRAQTTRHGLMFTSWSCNWCNGLAKRVKHLQHHSTVDLDACMSRCMRVSVASTSMFAGPFEDAKQH